MSNDLNKCLFIGRLGAEPELKTLPDGRSVANFRIAVGSSWKDKQTGDKQESVEWVGIVAFGKLADICGQYLNKGAQVFIEGRMRTRKWQDKEGKDRYTTEIIADSMQMLGGKRDSAEQSAPARERAPAPAKQTEEFDDEIPF
jgi:single-strand DNA-binding protein